MGQRGPVGKRPDQRHGHRTAAELSHDELAPRPVNWPAPGNWHDAAVRWYRALGESAQAVDYQQTDVETAWITADNLHKHLCRDQPMAGPAMAAFLSACTDLLATAGARRRAKLELSRPDPAQDQARAGAVASLSARRSA